MTTLETLRSDIAHALDVWDSEVLDENLRYVPEGLEEVRKAEQLYWIASHYSLEAAMLYKLSDGAIDPRKEVQS
jgi:hypothetical protein